MNANHVKRNLPYIIMAITAVSIFSVFFIIPLIFTTKYLVVRTFPLNFAIA